MSIGGHFLGSDDMDLKPTPVTDWYFARCQTTTLWNGAEVRSYDAFMRWQQEMTEYFATAKGYHGYPNLPDIWMDGDTLFEEAPADQRRMIAFSSMSAFTECLRHWKTYLDALYPGQDRTSMPWR